MTLVPLWAAIAMVAQDVLGTLLTQAQARDRAVLAGWLDSAGWLVSIFTTSWSVQAITGHNTALKLAVLGAVSVANFCGSWLGTTLGERLVRQQGLLPYSARLAALEAWAGTLGYTGAVA